MKNIVLPISICLSYLLLLDVFTFKSVTVHISQSFFTSNVSKPTTQFYKKLIKVDMSSMSYIYKIKISTTKLISAKIIDHQYKWLKKILIQSVLETLSILKIFSNLFCVNLKKMKEEKRMNESHKPKSYWWLTTAKFHKSLYRFI